MRICCCRASDAERFLSACRSAPKWLCRRFRRYVLAVTSLLWTNDPRRFPARLVPNRREIVVPFAKGEAPLRDILDIKLHRVKTRKTCSPLSRWKTWRLWPGQWNFTRAPPRDWRAGETRVGRTTTPFARPVVRGHGNWGICERTHAVCRKFLSPFSYTLDARTAALLYNGGSSFPFRSLRLKRFRSSFPSSPFLFQIVFLPPPLYLVFIFFLFICFFFWYLNYRKSFPSIKIEDMLFFFFMYLYSFCTCTVQQGSVLHFVYNYNYSRAVIVHERFHNVARTVPLVLPVLASSARILLITIDDTPLSAGKRERFENRYGWVNRESNYLRLTANRAMERLDFAATIATEPMGTFSNGL